MPFNGSGVFNLIYSWIQDAANGLAISSSRMTTQDADIAAGLSNTITRDGQGVPTAPITWGNQNLTSVAALGAATITASGTIAAGGKISRDAQFYLEIIGGNPFLGWDANDSDSYDRTNNIRNFAIGGTIKASLDTNGLNVLGNINASGVSTTSSAGTTGYTAISSGDATHTGIVGFFSAAGVRQGYVGFATTGGQIVYGSDTGAGHVFNGGSVTINGYTQVNGSNLDVVNGDLRSYRAGGTTGILFLNQAGDRYLYNDGTTYTLPAQGLNVGGTTSAPLFNLSNIANGYFASDGSGNPYINFDVSDQLLYDRAANAFDFNIGGVNQGYIAGDGAFHPANAANQRTVIGSTAVGDAVFTAASGAAARSAIGADAAYTPMLTTSATVGQIVSINTGSNYSLPAGGTWFFYYVIVNGTGNVANSSSDIQPGGTQIFVAAGNIARGFAIRIT